jgi:DNA-binding transcriptional MerR regulator
MPFTPKKLYYKIGEVCDILGVESYVLRYWESEFASLAPPKNKSGQRTYRPKDIQLLLKIKKLLYEDGFTIAGARKQLGTAAPSRTRGPALPPRKRLTRRSKAGHHGPVSPAAQPSERLSEVRAELENILTLLDRE